MVQPNCKLPICYIERPELQISYLLAPLQGSTVKHSDGWKLANPLTINTENLFTISTVNSLTINNVKPHKYNKTKHLTNCITCCFM